jgi:hypothetical protein
VIPSRHPINCEPAAKALSEKAKAILAFPNIVNGDFMVAAQYGEGVLIKDGQVASHDNAVAGSSVFKRVAPAFGYAMFPDARQSARRLGQELWLGSRRRSKLRAGKKRDAKLDHDDDGQRTTLTLLCTSTPWICTAQGASARREAHRRAPGRELNR